MDYVMTNDGMICSILKKGTNSLTIKCGNDIRKIFPQDAKTIKMNYPRYSNKVPVILMTEEKINQLWKMTK